MVIKKRCLFIVVLVVFFLVLFSSFLALAETEGCYVFSGAEEDLYCVAGILDTEVQADCNASEGCSMGQHFIPNSDCSEVSACDQITCNVDCLTKSRGQCTLKGGIEVPQNQYNEWCDPGCCKITGTNFCDFNLNLYECNIRAQGYGVSDPLDIIFDNVNMNLEKCIQNYCPNEIKKASLKGVILDKDDKPLLGVKVFFEGRTIPSQLTDSSGKYNFLQLNPGQYLLKATLEEYIPGSFSVSLAAGEKVEKNLTLIKPEGVATIDGIVKDKNGQPVEGATVSWIGLLSGQTFTNEEGKYKIENLPVGKYTFVASKLTLTPDEKEELLTKGKKMLDFTLGEQIFEGISGRTYIDVEPNGLLDPGEDRFGVKLYLNGVFKGYSEYSNGQYKISIALTKEEQEYELTATYEKYRVTKIIKLKQGQSLKDFNLLLTRFIGECSAPNLLKDVEDFIAHPIKGKKQVELTWKKPCPEVRSYLITRFKGGKKVGGTLEASPAENILIDAEVEWSETYTYKIIALYDEDVSQEVSTSIILGDELCENRYFENTRKWDLFCSNQEEGMARRVLTCNDQNKLDTSIDCTEKGNFYYCGKTNEHWATCKSSGVCGVQSQGADPFGLYYSRNTCYGSFTAEGGAQNFCYYDSTNTIVNSCNRCELVKSCFDYHNEDACKINNCLGTTCDWVKGAESNPLIDYNILFGGLIIPKSVTSETGAGYCVEADYEGDKCGLCGEEAGLFENYYCTAEVCSSLGRCFSNSVSEGKSLQFCASCGEKPTLETNCYTYQFESECTGGQNSEKNNREELTSSQDQCGWNKCAWLGKEDGSGSCVKDGDADKVSDCSLVTPGEEEFCRKDVHPPRTTLISEGLNIISLGQTNVTFQAVDTENQLGVVGFCLANANPRNLGICTDFTEVPYPGKLKDETLVINLLDSKYLEEEIPGETYELKYYSKDRFFNQEDVQTAFVYVDNVPPKFEINEKVDTLGDITDLTVYLEGTEEPMACSFDLEQILPSGNIETKTLNRDIERKEVSFEGLNGVKFELTVNCKDNHGNENKKIKSYTFDLEEGIEIVYPEFWGVVGSTEVSFKVNTLAGATCGLYLSADNSKVADFESDEEGKEHKTPKVPRIIEKEYAGDYKAVCKELFGEDIFQDYFQFSVDFTSPETQIILTEGVRESKPKKFNWEEFFVEKVKVSFECGNDGGFKCDKTFYCLGKGCESLKNQGYKEFTKEFMLEESSRICYYSTDIAKNDVYRPNCGDIKVEGYGITLEKPAQYYFEDEIWGVSDKTNFTWQFYTKVPTAMCKFDFNPEFDYKNIPPYKIKKPNENKRYVFKEFPLSIFSEYSKNGEVKQVYVKCENSDGEVGPEQKINLEFNPNVPEIKDAFASPNRIFEEIKTRLFVETDDKTLCRFSDNSTGEGSIEYETMEFAFPEEKDNILRKNHEIEYALNFLGEKKDFSFNVLCKNGGGVVSKLEKIRFNVDYSARGNILSVKPEGFTNQQNVTLTVQTTKKGVCKYKVGENFQLFPKGANTNLHTIDLGNLKEGEYKIPIKCILGDQTAEAQAIFNVDLTPPVISEINDNTLSCGKEELEVQLVTNEINLTGYFYEVFDLGPMKNISAASLGLESSSSDYYSKYLSSRSNGGLLSLDGKRVFNKTVGPGLPMTVSTTWLKQGNHYVVKVRPIDAAKNWGGFKEGDGFIVSSENETICEEDNGAPKVTVFIDDETSASCSATLVSLSCKDLTSCKLRYGQSASASQCNPVLSSSGQKIAFRKTSWLCYSASDLLGNNYTKKQIVVFKDEDSDTVSDNCDECPDTGVGKIANQFGCAEGQVSSTQEKLDSDKDSLPDVWEITYDDLGCDLNYLIPDSNDNGDADPIEDYDSDGLSNYEEYLQNKNPCIADEVKAYTCSDGSVVEDMVSCPIFIKKEGDTLAWILLLLGLVMVLGGLSYLIYNYSFGVKRVQSRIVSRPFTIRSTAPVAQPGVISGWKNKLVQIKRARKEKLRIRERSSIFSKFSTESKTIPHVDQILKKKAPSVSRVGELANKYSQHKEVIKPGLRREELGVFSKLEGISKKTKDKLIHEVVDKKEAKDIFAKLKKISEQRKK